MPHAPDVRVVDGDEDVSLPQALAPPPVQDLLDLLPEAGVGDGEAEAHAALDDGHRHQRVRVVLGGQGRAHLAVGGVKVGGLEGNFF